MVQGNKIFNEAYEQIKGIGPQMCFMFNIRSPKGEVLFFWPEKRVL